MLGIWNLTAIYIFLLEFGNDREKGFRIIFGSIFLGKRGGGETQSHRSCLKSLFSAPFRLCVLIQIPLLTKKESSATLFFIE